VPAPALFTHIVEHDAPGAKAVAIAEVTGDQVNDVIYADDSLTLWAQTSVERQAILTNLPFALDVMTVADLDGDGGVDLIGNRDRRLVVGGLLEIASISRFSDQLVVLRQATSLGFPEGESFDLPGTAVGDLDSDGRADVAVLGVAKLSVFVAGP
jgi:hypothetical protein